MAELDSQSQASQQPSGSGDKKSKADPNTGLWIRAAKAVVYAGKRISDAACRLFIIIRDYQGNNSHAWVGVERLAADMDRTPRRVQQLIKELEAVGAIEVVERPGTTNHYRTCFLELKSSQEEGQAHLSVQVVNADRKTVPTVVAALTKPTPVSQTSQAISLQQKVPFPIETTAITCGLKQTYRKVRRVTQAPDNDFQQLSLNWEDDLSPTAISETQVVEISEVKYVSPLPPKKNSPKLESRELESKVCEKTRITHKQMSGKVQRVVKTRPGEQGALFTRLSKRGMLNLVNDSNRNLRLQNRVEVQPTAEQAEIAALLCAEGVAEIDAASIAVGNPNKGDVLGWIELAQGKRNPGGYLKVMLLDKSGVKPPAILPKGNNRTGAGTANYFSRQPNHETPAMAYIRRHQYDEQQETLELAPCALTEIVNANYYVKLAEGKQKVSEEEWQNQNPAIEPKLEGLIQQLDLKASQNLRQARIEGNIVLIEFKRGYYLPFYALDGWLSTIKRLHSEVNEIRLI